jgi:hypothetical protein
LTHSRQGKSPAGTCRWWSANSSAGVQVGPRRFTARIANDAERESLWPMMARIFPLYDEYAQKTDRQIPLVLLTSQD